ncbi:hypothetical protein BT93_B0992 [Corymbia citriodora subsp. variegata]|nr:hypothetical protein BT93_B0992 [Corymbia citriodora subsp. variegata]
MHVSILSIYISCGFHVKVGTVSLLISLLVFFELARMYRYCMVANHWRKESSVPTKAPCNCSFGFVALDGELYVMTLLNGNDLAESRRSRFSRRGGALFVQVYCPRKKTWRTLVAKSPLLCPLDFRTAVMCTIHL